MFFLKMLLAHLVGDYVVQGDRIANWKARAVSGVLVHGLIVTIVTVLFAYPYDLKLENFYAALAIGAIHTLIDFTNFVGTQKIKKKDGLSSLVLFLCDQMAHICSIIGVSAALGQLPTPSEALFILQNNPTLTLAFAYIFISMPAWVLITFALGSLRNSGPDFVSATKSKYTTIIERGIFMTLILFGQAFLMPLIAVPRLLQARANVEASKRRAYISEWVLSVLLTLAVAYTVQQLINI